MDKDEIHILFVTGFFFFFFNVSILLHVQDEKLYEEGGTGVILSFFLLICL